MLRNVVSAMGCMGAQMRLVTQVMRAISRGYAEAPQVTIAGKQDAETLMPKSKPADTGYVRESCEGCFDTEDIGTFARRLLYRQNHV